MLLEYLNTILAQRTWIKWKLSKKKGALSLYKYFHPRKTLQKDINTIKYLKSNFTIGLKLKLFIYVLM